MTYTSDSIETEPNACGMRERNDCSVLALAACSGIPYDIAYLHMKAFGRVANCPVTPTILLNAYISAGMRLLPRMQPDELKAKIQQGKYIVWCTGHVFCIIDGKVQDKVEPTKSADVIAVFELKGK